MAASSNRLPFPPVTEKHILNCSYHAWHPRYRSLTPKSRLIALSSSFVNYLRADGIILPPEHPAPNSNAQNDDGYGDHDSSEDEDTDPSTAWPETHQSVLSTIHALDGRVAPKLNWSAPKDATWINPTNSMECRSANDVYMMLKSSDFVTHDLEHAFDDCVDALSSPESATEPTAEVPYHLVLRKWVSAWNPSVEFRCFVRARRLLGLCQRDLNYYDFLSELRPKIIQLVQDFFDSKLKDTFADENFVFDVYVPQPYTKVWLVDINPWAIRTDPILFSWKELLEMDDPIAPGAEVEDLPDDAEWPDGNFVRVPLRIGTSILDFENALRPAMPPTPEESSSSSEGSEDDLADDLAPAQSLELRLIRRGDPEAYTFNTPQYSAHKLPRDVVDASTGVYDAEQLKDFSQKWQELDQRRSAQHKEDEARCSDDDEG